MAQLNAERIGRRIAVDEDEVVAREDLPEYIADGRWSPCDQTHAPGSAAQDERRAFSARSRRTPRAHRDGLSVSRT